MRHAYILRLTVGIAAWFVIASGLFALAAVADRSTSRVDIALGLEPNPADGAMSYSQGSDPACADCHSLAAAGITADGGPDLDDLSPTRENVIMSIVGETVGAHEAANLAVEFSDRELADLSAYVRDAVDG